MGVLRAFEAGSRDLGLAEIAGAAGISKSAAQRFTHTLEGLGYLRRDESGRRWRLSPRALDFGAAFLASDPLIERANQHLVDLNYATGESVNLSQADGPDMVFVARFTSHSRSFVHMPVGTRIPMFCAASGRAFLSAMPEGEALDLISASRIVPFTARTQVDPGRILEEVRLARERGFASAAEEFYLGDLNIAAPVVGGDGRPLGAVNVSGPTTRWTIERMEGELAAMLIETARKISSGPTARVRRDSLTQQGGKKT